MPVCRECIAALRPIEGNTCSVCGELLVSSVAGVVAEPICGSCQNEHPPFETAVAYGSYHAGLRELIHLLKYDHLLPAANVLARMLTESIARIEPRFGSHVLVIPVPLHNRKFRARGFNQAELIARKALKLLGKPELKRASRFLLRVRETQSQIGLTSHQRRENMRGAFAAYDSSQIKGREILLLDDVYTTGTTVSECSRVLLRAGASKIWVATVARTLKAQGESMKFVEEQAVASAHA